MKLTKKHLFLLSFAFLFLAALAYTLFPKTTVASILHLDKKEQIVKVELGVGIAHQYGLVFSEAEAEWRDITQTELGKRYVDALFYERAVSKNIIENSMGLCVEGKLAAIRITLDGLPDGYPFTDRTHMLLIGLPTESPSDLSTIPLRLHYTTQEQIRQQEKRNAEGRGEVVPDKLLREFDLSHNELFTLDFIQKQFE